LKAIEIRHIVDIRGHGHNVSQIHVCGFQYGLQVGHDLPEFGLKSSFDKLSGLGIPASCSGHVQRVAKPESQETVEKVSA